MDTHVRTPLEIFLHPQHLVVPPFQRPYVWDEEEQWAPLWQDVRRMAEVRLRDGFSKPTHFLGAVVLQAQDHVTGNLKASNIIDGQQRLTTLLLLMDAVGLILEEARLESLADQLEVLTHNQAMYISDGDPRLKLRHTNKDQAAFDEVMDAEPPVDHTDLRHSGSRVVRAHGYFSEAAAEWLGDIDDDEFATRAETLVAVLTGGLQLVAIDLAANENSQEIFETLNARGTPLTAADLIKNFVFQQLANEGADTKRVYAEDWPFETKFWEKEVSVGRYKVSRSSLFFNQWLASRIGEEVSPKSTFASFKRYVEDGGRKVADLLPVIKEQAAMYEAWTIAAEDPDRQLSRVEMAVYRMQASGVELLTPLLIWLHEPGRGTPREVIDEVVAAAESWVIRRQLLRLSGSDLGRIVADIIHTQSGVPVAELPDRVRGYLSRLNVSSTYWPGDDEVRESLREEQAYRRFKRGRLRMLLEAVENRHRQRTNQPQVPRRGYPIEHVLPQNWTHHWPVIGLEAEQERAARVHRLGNLTLLTTSLNSKVSNGPWPGKRDALQEHDTLLLNSRLLADVQSGEWTEAGIDARTDQLINTLLAIWPVPAGHEGKVADPHEKSGGWIEIKHLVAAGLLEPGEKLIPRSEPLRSREATIRDDGLIEIDGKTFSSPSGAGGYVRGGKSTNGWYFWQLADGRSLKDVRAAYAGAEPVKPSEKAFDWSALHTILEALPDGYWTTYGDLADAVGTAAQPLGNHVTRCQQCTNAHRILTREGKVAENFAWLDPADERDPLVLLSSEGLAFAEDRADPDRRLSCDDLADLVDET
jgi:alkylated DNA nucleotide flippase Atl1